MKRKKIIGIVIVCVVVILAGVGIYRHIDGDVDVEDFPFYMADSYEDLKRVLDGAEDTFLLPDEQIMLSDYSFGFYNIWLDEPRGVPVGYDLSGLDQPGADHYKMTVEIRCSQNASSKEDSELIETYQGIDIITDGNRSVIFEMYGYRYTIESDISSDLGGFQGEDLEIAEGLRIAKNMIDSGSTRE